MAKKKQELELTTPNIDENLLFSRVSAIIENRKARAGSYANQEVTLMFWEIGHFIIHNVLDGKRADYGKQIVTTLSSQLMKKYGKQFDIHNIRRMVRFAEKFNNLTIVTELAPQLSWSHFIEILPLKSDDARLYYINEVAKRHLGTKELRRQIARKAYERQEIANSQLKEDSIVPFNVFKDPYLLDTLGLKENFLEADLEKAILKELEAFILEFGHGFAFVERQKRMTMDGDDYTADLVFYHRVLKRLVVIELKIGKFMPEYIGQMQFYLKWLNRYERKPDENEPIGLILCTKASRNQIELMELDKFGIAVAEYWTELPPKELLEEKIKSIMIEAKERLERRRNYPDSVSQRQIDYFYDVKDDIED
ncbi:MAG: PDDEXK nuclease domain-containing protein [Treponema sp.]|nr:PDDEXK nuclease domain-containing protein [Treponema sp.]